MTTETVEGLIAALQALKPEHVAALPPVERRRLVEALATALRVAQTDASAPRSGILADLNAGRRAE